MNIGYVQFEPAFGEVSRNLDVIKRLISTADGADLLVLPELATSGYTFVSREEAFDLAEVFTVSPNLDRLQQAACDRSCALVVGFPERDGDRLFNAAALLFPDGTRRCYRKIHLYAAEKKWFTPGDRPFSVCDVKGTTIGIMICFDWIFPESARVLALKGARVVCQPSNLVLPWCQRSMITRSIENRIFTITANRVGTETRGPFSHTFTGESQVTGPDGTVLVSAQRTGESVALVEIDPTAAEDKCINEFNDLFNDRRPEFYREIANGRLNGNLPEIK